MTATNGIWDATQWTADAAWTDITFHKSRISAELEMLDSVSILSTVFRAVREFETPMVAGEFLPVNFDEAAAWAPESCTP